MVVKLNPKFKQTVHDSERAHQERESYFAKIHARRRKIIRLVTLGILLVCGLTIGYRLVQYQLIKHQIAEVNVQKVRVSNENKNLKGQVRALHDDDYVQQLIREKYMYTKQGEQVYNLPANDPDANK